jgi:DNA-binding response OmpR family regulator
MTVANVRKTTWSYVLDEPTRVLVADDDPILLEFASVYLSSPSATIATICDGKAAFDLLMTEPFDIAVLDIEMPILDGFGLLEKIRSEPALSLLPVMMLTGHEDIASIDRAFNLGANAFALKPVNWRLLSYQIRYVLRSSRIERQLRADRNVPPLSGEGTIPSCDSSITALSAVHREATAFCRGAEVDSLTPAEACLRRIEGLASNALRDPKPGSGTSNAGDPVPGPQTFSSTRA